MFLPDFYPTPDEVIDQMCAGLDLTGKRVLEPSAGSGNIVDYLKAFGADVMACETNNTLASVVSSKCRFLKPDFMKVEAHEISHVDYIIMNPPFSADERHILHAFEIAPAGCTIVALCNYATVKNNYTTSREKLTDLIKLHGHSLNLGNVFSSAERKTETDIGMIKLHKPGSGKNEFEGYFDMSEEMEHQQNGMMTYSKAQDIVSRYVGAVKLWDEIQPIAENINSLIKPINSYLGIGFGAHWTDSNKHHSKLNRDIFKKELQKSAWRSIFSEMNMSKYVTGGVMADINKFVEQQQSVPFTVKNIYKMCEVIVGTHAGRMDKVLVEAFDHICSLSHDNSEAGEKWKTNSNYKINMRFINSRVCDYDKRWPTDSVNVSYSGESKMDDIVKALCHLTGKSYDEVMKADYKTEYSTNNTLSAYFRSNPTPWGEWRTWTFFRVKGYMKGTMHFEFLDEAVWMEFNRRVAKIKGWQLPKKTDTKKKGTERTKKAGVEIWQPKPKEEKEAPEFYINSEGKICQKHSIHN